MLKLAAAVSCAVLALACGSGPAWDGGQTCGSDRFRYHTREGDKPTCPQTLAALERHLSWVLGALRAHWPEGATVEYYKYQHAADYRRSSGCPATTKGCYVDGSVRTSSPFHTHELVHAYADVVWGKSGRFLSEGLAVALSCSPAPALLAAADWRPLFVDFRQHTRQAYPLAGSFVTHLLLEYGPERFERLYRGVKPEDSDEDFQSIFDEVYGLPLDQVWRRASTEAWPPCLFVPRSAESTLADRPQLIDAARPRS